MKQPSAERLRLAVKVILSLPPHRQEMIYRAIEDIATSHQFEVNATKRFEEMKSQLVNANGMDLAITSHPYERVMGEYVYDPVNVDE